MGYTPPFLFVQKVAGGWNVYGPGVTTGNVLTILADAIDADPSIIMTGGGNLALSTPANLLVYASGTLFAILNHTANNSVISPTADDNLFLNPTGTGKVKFGTYGAQGDTATSGYVTILSNDGTPRKLAVIA